MAVQAIGFAALIIFIISFQCRSNRILFMLQLIGMCLFSLQYYLLGAYSGSISMLISIVRNILLLRINESRCVQWKGWRWIFIAAFLIVAVVTWDGFRSILSFLASAVSAYFYWENNAGKIRLCNLAAVCPCWMLYALISGSIGGFLNEVLIMSSILISVRRFGWKALFDPAEQE